MKRRRLRRAPEFITSCLVVFGTIVTGAFGATPDAVVAADGSGQYKTVQEAINSAPQTTSIDRPWVILIKPGTYKEVVYVQREKRHVHLLGKDPQQTILTYNLHANMKGLDGLNIGTFRTPTVTIDADDFTVENLTFENSAGPVGQALAVRVDGDRATFRNCRFLGYQDTIFVNRGRQYFEGCTIVGTVDFIFGGATAYFSKCTLHSLRDGYITAASTPSAQPFGFVFADCRITAGTPDTKIYLGRPWRSFASTIFINTEMSGSVRPEGWHNWDKPEREKTTRYAEFNSTPAPSGRVAWARQLTADEAGAINAGTVLTGTDGWNPAKTITNTPARATVTYDIEYGRAAEQSLRLDASAPAGKGPFPMVIIVHGGGWSGGDKQLDITGLFEPLTQAGFVWFSINYRLAPAHRWPAAFEDVQTAIRWAKAHAPRYNGDPNRIALIGYSAGGQLVSLAAIRGDDATRVQAVVGLAPVEDFVADMRHRGKISSSLQNLLGVPEPLSDETLARLREISPIDQLKPGAPPFLLIQGSADTTVLPEHTAGFAAKLKETGVPCETITLSGATHRIADWDNFDATYKQRMIEWLQRQLPASR